jgi:hypothetical protein
MSSSPVQAVAGLRRLRRALAPLPRVVVILLPPLAVALLLVPPSNRFFRQHRAARGQAGANVDAPGVN